MSQFDKIYVINLPNRTDRKRQIEKQLEKVNLSFLDSRVEIFEACRPNNKGKWPTIGARGCFYSHLNLLKCALRNGYDSVLILEDDVDWSDSFLKNAETTLDLLEGLDWDLLHGGIKSGFDAPAFIRVLPTDELLLSHFVAIRGEVISQVVSYLESMAKREGGHPLGGPMHVDGAYNWFRKDNPTVSAYLATPAIALQRPSRTDVHELAWPDRTPILSHIINYFRPVVGKARRAISRSK